MTTLNIRPGDILVMEGVDYPVRSVNYWVWNSVSRGIRRICNLTASTKRNPDPVGGKVGSPVAFLAEINVSPLDPVDRDARRRVGLDALNSVKSTVSYDDDGFYVIYVEDLTL